MPLSVTLAIILLLQPQGPWMGASGSSWCCKHQVAPPELFRAMPNFFQFSLKDWGMKSETPKGWGVSEKQATSRWLDLENVFSNIQNKIRVWGGRYLCVHWASSFISLHLTFLNTVWEQRDQQVPQIHLTPSLLSPTLWLQTCCAWLSPGCWVLNSSPHAYTVSILPTEPSTRPLEIPTVIASIQYNTRHLGQGN